MPATRTIAFLVATLAWSAIAGSGRADEWQETYHVRGRPTLRLETGDGRVQVSLGSERRVTVRVITRGWRIRRGQVTVQARQTEDRIEVEVREPRLRFDLFLPPRRIAVEVSLPRDSDVWIGTGDGSVRVPALRGTVDVRSGDGEVVAEGVEGDIRLRTGDGRIRAHGVRGALEARSGDGRVEVAGRFERLFLRTGDGPIAVEVEPGSRLAAPWEIVTGDGSVQLLVPDDLAADLDLHARDGRIDVDVPLTLSGRLRPNAIRGALRGGGPLLRVRTGDGRIRIAPLKR